MTSDANRLNHHNKMDIEEEEMEDTIEEVSMEVNVYMEIDMVVVKEDIEENIVFYDINKII
jgi:hypothetical protein